MSLVLVSSDDDDDDDDDDDSMEFIAQSYATRENRTNAGTRKSKDGGGHLAVSVDRDVEKNRIHVRIESTFNVRSKRKRNGTIVDQGRWTRPMERIVWLELKCPIENVLEEIEEMGLSGVTMEDVKEMIREGMRKKEKKVNVVVERDTNADVRDIFFELDFDDENEAFDSLSEFNVYCEIECVAKGYSRPFTLTLPPSPTDWWSSDFCLIGNESEGGSEGLSKFAHMAMKELEELREAVREKSSSKMDKEAASASQKRKEVPLEVKKKSPRKKKPMGGGFGTIKKK